MERADEYEIIRVILPFILLLIYIAVSSLLLPPVLFVALLSIIITYILSPVGRWIIPMAIALGFPWWYAGLTIWLLDILGALFMAWNFGYLFSLPRLGPFVERVIQRIEDILGTHPWLERFTEAALLLYVTLPIQGAGALMGSVIGRFLGIDPWRVFLIIVIGSLAGSFGMALGSDALRLLLIGNIVLGIAIIIILAGIMIAGYLSLRAIRRRRL
ncbi:putative membrane protein [Methanocalculus alkaliphilus]|uniref:small multi-drug export protein n=1 Tax=Methanocalculus alkaliphilus TaxID=768730 RepID=UPI00209CA023|nr:putative membrane protein [Methanocalculus alkaliphilus]